MLVKFHKVFICFCYKGVRFIDNAFRNNGCVLIVDRITNEKCITVVVGFLMYKDNLKFRWDTFLFVNLSRWFYHNYMLYSTISLRKVQWLLHSNLQLFLNVWTNFIWIKVFWLIFVTSRPGMFTTFSRNSPVTVTNLRGEIVGLIQAE